MYTATWVTWLPWITSCKIMIFICKDRYNTTSDSSCADVIELQRGQLIFPWINGFRWSRGDFHTLFPRCCVSVLFSQPCLICHYYCLASSRVKMFLPAHWPRSSPPSLRSERAIHHNFTSYYLPVSTCAVLWFSSLPPCCHNQPKKKKIARFDMVYKPTTF